eukprot:TRINITY_DN1887_c0_g1_i4.p1 TRINITY_DN1887_c0_g1~~TRINITY_DN1887_c0_g1_i4.p1  ORF type:complete len:620 (-),score=56.10 TRINITY_DN1887_c0_g1_i4:421-2280(-)
MFKQPESDTQQFYSSLYSQRDPNSNNQNGRSFSASLQHTDTRIEVQEVTNRAVNGTRGQYSSGRGRAVRADHLLNFQYDTHSRTRYNNRFNRGGGRPNKRKTNNIQVFSKEQFLQANFKFYVSDCVDLEKHAKDPDLPFNWEDIAWVEMMTDTDVQCPISLESPPFCPQITPCGHLYSFPSIVHYLYLQDNNLRAPAPCPLCFEPLSARELRDAKIERVTHIQEGDNIEFVLARREKSKQIVEVFNENLCFTKYVGISDASDIYVDTVTNLATLATQTIKEGGTEVQEIVPYLYSCVDVTAIKARCWAKRRAQLQHNPEQIVGQASNADIADVEEQAHAAEEFVRQAFLKAEQEGRQQEFDLNACRTSLEKRIGSRSHPDYYYFYQCKDGQCAFMLPLNARCLLAQYGSWEMCPPTIHGEVLEVEEHVCGEEERKRWKFLSHLPQSSLFKFCEIKMNMDDLPAAMQFKKDIQKRQRARDAAARDLNMSQNQDNVKPAPAAFLSSDFITLTSQVNATSIEDQPGSATVPVPSSQNLGTQGSSENSEEGSSPPKAGISFASVTKLGYAAASSSEQRPNDHQLSEQSSSAGSKPAQSKASKKFKGKIKGKKFVLSAIQRKVV